MKSCYCWLAGLLLLLGVCAGCGKKSAPAQTRNLPAYVFTDQKVWWMPQKPSPEFLRAAKVIKKPLFDDPGKLVSLQEKAGNERFRQILVPAWELFGTLSDAQIKHLLNLPHTRKRDDSQLRLPYRKMTTKQQAALRHYFDVYNATFKGHGDTEWPEDALVALYKCGAREDLSNLVVAYKIRGSGRLAMYMYVIQRDGKLLFAGPLGLGDV
jgi:hypothetical protein